MLQRRLAGNEKVKTNGREDRSLTERLEPERKEDYRTGDIWDQKNASAVRKIVCSTLPRSNSTLFSEFWGTDIMPSSGLPEGQASTWLTLTQSEVSFTQGGQFC